MARAISSISLVLNRFNFTKSLYPNATIATTSIAKDKAFHIPLSNNIIAVIPSVAVIPYNIKTDCLCVYPLAINLWCRCPLSALNTPFIDFVFTILLIIAHNVSNIGSAKTIIGAIKTIAVYVFATPKIEITDSINPIKFDPTSPIKVLAGLKLYGRNPTIAPANAVVSIIAIIGDWFSENTIMSDIQDNSVIPDDNPSRPSLKFIAFVIPTIHRIVII